MLSCLNMKKNIHCGEGAVEEEGRAALPRNEASLRVLDGCCWHIYVYTYAYAYTCMYALLVQKYKYYVC